MFKPLDNIALHIELDPVAEWGAISANFCYIYRPQNKIQVRAGLFNDFQPMTSIVISTLRHSDVDALWDTLRRHQVRSVIPLFSIFKWMAITSQNPNMPGYDVVKKLKLDLCDQMDYTAA